MQQTIITLINEALKILNVEEKIDSLDRPTHAQYGDFSSSIALKLVKALKKPPLQIAQEIVKNIKTDKVIEKVEVVKPGFINFWLSNEVLINILRRYTDSTFDFPTFYYGSQKKIIVEYAHPNTHKLFHIGHLRNISIGESVVRLLESTGNKVIRANYQGDVGLHIAKCLYQARKQKETIKTLKTLQDKIEFLGKTYSEGQKAYEEDPLAKEEIHKINKMIYERNPEILDLWKDTVSWSLQYFEEIYKRVDTHFDRCYFESEVTDDGLKISKEQLTKGILEKSEGAVVFNGKKYGIDTRVFINSLGLPTYEGKELGLAKREFSDFGEVDKCIHCVTPEQSSFFSVTFKVEELIDEKRYKGKQYHLAYNWVKLKDGKMSSRTGNVIQGMWLIDEAKKKLKEKFSLNDQTAETLAIASVKYSFLKVSPQMEIYFDFDESISLEGNSAPYINYTYVRTQGILGKTKIPDILPNILLNEDESFLLRKIAVFPLFVWESAKKLAPHIIAGYLYDLAQQYNNFYQKNPVLKAEKEKLALRIYLTQSVGNILKKGLFLLGIKTVEKM